MYKVILCLRHLSVEDYFFYFSQINRIERASFLHVFLHLSHVESAIGFAHVFHYNFSGYRHICIER